MGLRLRDNEDEKQPRGRWEWVTDLGLIVGVFLLGGIVFLATTSDQDGDQKQTPASTSTTVVNLNLTSVPLEVDGEKWGECDWRVTGTSVGVVRCRTIASTTTTEGRK